MATITLSKSNYYELTPAINKGELIKVCHYKRVWLKVIDTSKYSAYSHTLTLKPLYKPAPKSRLRNKSVFSKFKGKIIY